MKIVTAVLLLALSAAPALASSGEAQSTAPAAQVPAPLSVAWLPAVLLGILWLVIAAAILGPLVSWLNIMPRSSQLFEDERGHGHMHSAAAHASH